jgi:hypothetical protein
MKKAFDCVNQNFSNNTMEANIHDMNTLICYRMHEEASDQEYFISQNEYFKGDRVVSKIDEIHLDYADNGEGGCDDTHSYLEKENSQLHNYMNCVITDCVKKETRKLKFKCNQDGCHKEYKSKENLNLHIKNIHDMVKPYNCRFCKSSFSHRNGNIIFYNIIQQ